MGSTFPPSLRDDDLRRLARVVDQLGGGGSGPVTAEQFAGGERTVATTPAGELAVVPTPWGTRGYDGLRIRSNRENLGNGIRPPIASLADCVRMLDGSDRSIDRDRIQRVRRMMELERQLARSRQPDSRATAELRPPRPHRAATLTSIAGERQMHRSVQD